MKVAVVVPAYNEAKAIQEVVRSIPRSIAGGHSTFIVVVDDGSSDSTSDEARMAGADIVWKHNRNRGVGASLRTGVRAAVRLGADIVCTLDADGQLNPMEIPDVVNPILSGRADAVVGTRFNDVYSNSSIPMRNYILNVLLSVFLSVLLLRRLTDVCSGYRAFHVRTVPVLKIEDKWDTFGFILDIACAGYRLAEAPVSVKYFVGRKSRVVTNSLSFALTVLKGLILRTLPVPRKPKFVGR